MVGLANGREPHLTSRICQNRWENAVNVNDYLIDHAGFDWQALLAGWAEVLPETFAIWLVNRFGDVFIIADDGSVHRLDAAVGTLDRLADTRDQFADLIDVPQNANNWLMIPLVDQCVMPQLDLIPEDGGAFAKAAKAAGLKLSKKKSGFLIQGEDRPGAVAEVAEKLAQAAINVTSIQAFCTGAARYGGMLWVKPSELRKAAKALGVR
jgi:hypothetical protein